MSDIPYVKLFAGITFLAGIFAGWYLTTIFAGAPEPRGALVVRGRTGTETIYIHVCMFQEERCKCQKGRCNTRSCRCRKSGRQCSRSRCGCGQCENLEQMDVEDSAAAGEGSTSVMSASASSVTGATSSSSLVQMRCQEEDYNPAIHNAPWHNDRPFVLQEYNKKMKNCLGCKSKLADRRELDLKFVISHEEQREFWTRYGRKTALQKAFYHCSASCISARHAYFKPREVTASPSVARKLTAEDILLIKHHGIDLAFMHIQAA